MSYFYKLIIQYDGTGFKGWQLQKTGEKTIQGELNKSLSQLVKGASVHSVASGRTDAGVHAQRQYVRVELPISIDTQGILKGLNSILHHQISVISVSESDSNFHPVFNAKEKEYHYFFSEDSLLHPLEARYVTVFRAKLDLSLIQKACEILVGEHDFCNYFTKGTETKTTVRTIFRAGIFESESGRMYESSTDVYCFKIAGNGFLKQMVRMLMGALINIGSGKVTLEQFKNSLDGTKQKLRMGAVAPPQGLALYQVKY